MASHVDRYPDRFADPWATTFDARKFLRRHKLAPSTVAEDLKLGPTILYQWFKKEKLPLSVYKALVMKYAPADAVDAEQSMRVFKNPQTPFLLPNALREACYRYDQQRTGARLQFDDGSGYLRIPDVSRTPKHAYDPGKAMEIERTVPPARVSRRRVEVAPEVPAPEPTQEVAAALRLEAPAPPPQIVPPVLPTPTPADFSAVGGGARGVLDGPLTRDVGRGREMERAPDAETQEVLLALLVRLQQERNEWRSRALTNDHALIASRARAETAEERVRTLEGELKSYERQLEELTRPGASTASGPALPASAVERAQRVVARRAPSLVQELADLPKTMGALD